MRNMRISVHSFHPFQLFVRHHRELAMTDAIMDVARRHGLVVIEDNAQCVLGSCRGRLAGTYGQMASYSFENTKHRTREGNWGN